MVKLPEFHRVEKYTSKLYKTIWSLHLKTSPEDIVLLLVLTTWQCSKRISDAFGFFVIDKPSQISNLGIFIRFAPSSDRGYVCTFGVHVFSSYIFVSIYDGCIMALA